jgi:hypothetical protein
MNFAKWKSGIMMILIIMDWDHSFHEDKPVEPVAKGANDTTLALRKADYKKAKTQWESSDRVVFMIMDNTIDLAIRGALPKTAKNAKLSWLKLKNIFRDPLKLMLASLYAN